MTRRSFLIVVGSFLLVFGIDYGTNVGFGAWYWSLMIGAGFAFSVLGLTDDR